MCNSCYKKRQQHYSRVRQNSPEKLRKQREYRIKREYHIDMNEYEKRMSESDVCECCKEPPTEKRPLVYDHCHVTMAFRGILCDRCNTAIGKLGDNIQGLKNAIKYLEKRI